jgi:gamma-glutamyltranspeptidase/glutathione hydrolase
MDMNRAVKVAGAVLVMGSIMDAAFMEAQERSQTRSMVITRTGIVAAENPLAAQAGTMILAQGGNAVDAAVATNAAMGLMAPTANGIGGDLFAIVYEAKTGKLYGLNSSGWAPKAQTVEFLKTKSITKMPERGVYTVTVPGTVAGWSALLAKFGSKKFSEVLAPAIRYAEEGFPVPELVSRGWAASVEMHKRDANATKTYLIDGTRGPRVGEIFRNPHLAWSLKQIAAGGGDAYYKGEIAKRIVETTKRFGGVMEPSDLAEFSAEWVEPISTEYRGWKVYEIPPNGQGIAALAMLNLMENFAIKESGHNTAQTLHTEIEAKKLAYADMLKYVADPRFAEVPVAGMLSKDYAKARAKLINATKANCSVSAGTPPSPGTDTTYLTVVDSEGNMVSLIQSNYSGFGSGIVPDGTGFMLHNRGALFTLEPGLPNSLAGRKRPLHTIIPAFMEKGDVRIAFGIMGGWNQSQAHAQFVSNVVDHGMNIQAALEAARFTKLTFEGCDVMMEARVKPDVRGELETLGHKIRMLGDYSGQVGGGQAVLRDFAAKLNYGASDPRKDGAAMPEPPK